MTDQMTIDPAIWLGTTVGPKTLAKLHGFAAAVWDQGWAAGTNDAYDDAERRDHPHGETIAPNPYRTKETA